MCAHLRRAGELAAHSLGWHDSRCGSRWDATYSMLAGGGTFWRRGGRGGAGDSATVQPLEAGGSLIPRGRLASIRVACFPCQQVGGSVREVERCWRGRGALLPCLGGTAGGVDWRRSSTQSEARLKSKTHILAWNVKSYHLFYAAFAWGMTYSVTKQLLFRWVNAKKT